MRNTRGFLAAGLLASLALAACSSGATSGGSPGAVTVEAGDTSCVLGTATLPAGRHTLAVTNSGSQVTEVYVYAAGDRIVGEVENVGPATSRNLIVDLTPGSYQVACKPGMVGSGLRTALSVSGSAAPTQTVARDLQAAVDDYRHYVEAEAQALVDTTAVLAQRIDAEQLTAAQQAYPAARLHYERIEPIAESFGNLDPLLDMRVDDATGGAPFVGFHAIERLLFSRHTLTGTETLATALRANVARLNTLVATVRFTPLVMANGAKSLLDEVAKSKVTGEEERYSRIDLLDFAGNVDGSRSAYAALRPTVATRDPALATELDHRFRALVALLGQHRSAPGRAGYIAGSPYVSYDALSAGQVKALAVSVDAVSESLGRLAGVVTSG